MAEEKARESLASRLGFILLSAGCAIGLGNVWRFPYIVGKYGGALFVLIYLLFLVVIGLPVMVMEFSIGRASRRNIAGALTTLEPKGTKWHLYGKVAIGGNYLLMMFYTVITGWLLYYFWSSLNGNITGLSGDAAGEYFSTLHSKPMLMVALTWLGIVIGFAICSLGLKNGVEKITKIMMICLLVLIIALAVHSCILPGAGEGLSFYLKPNMDAFEEHSAGEIIFAAMSQAFFTLSIGMGGMTIFGSYTDKQKSLTGESGRVIALDTFVAIMSGFIIFPACFSFGVNPDAGPGLLFVTLPNIFAQMAGGRLWGSLFFLFMAFAAMTTLVAVFENIIAYWIDEKGWSRGKAVIVNCIAIMILCIPCALGFNLLSGWHPLGPGTVVLDLEDFLVSSTIMPLGSLLLIIFCTTKKGWGWQAFLKEADEGTGAKFPAWIKNYVKWVLPAVIIVIFLKGYWDIFSKFFV